MAALARLIVRLSAWIAPAADRSRWREEWLAEIDSAAARSSSARLLRHAAGAPWDAATASARAVREGSGRLSHGWKSDWRQTRRALWHSPRHAATVILCLGAGIVVNVTMLSVLNSFFYGEIYGVQDRSSVVRLYVGYGESTGGGPPRTSLADEFSLLDFRSLTSSLPPALRGVAAEGHVRLAVTHEATTTATLSVFVSSDYFPVLGTPPLHGRLLHAADHAPDAPPAVVVSERFAREKFGTPADLPGRTILIAGREFVVVGVAPPKFTGLRTHDDPTEVWIPLRFAERWAVAPPQDRAWLEVHARLHESAAIEDVRAALAPAAARLSAEQPDARANAYYAAFPHGQPPGVTAVEMLAGFSMMMAIPLILLAVACLNVANLQLARATTRAREFALRLAIGASRGQVIRLLTMEAAALASAGTIVGVAGAAAAMQVLESYFPLVMTLDWRVLLATLSLTTGVTMLAGVAPAWVATRSWSAQHLRHTAQGGGLPHTRLRHALVILQIATSFVLVAGSNLFVRTAQAMRSDIPEYVQQQVIARFDLAMLGQGGVEATRIARELEQRLSTRGDVAAVSFDRLFFGSASANAVPVEDPATWLETNIREVTPGFAAVNDVRVLAGRWLTSADTTRHVVVNERFAREIDPQGGNVVGRTVWLRGLMDCENPPCRDAPLQVEIVGVVESQRRLAQQLEPPVAVFRALPQIPVWFDMRVRTAQPAALGADLRGVVQSVDSRLPWLAFWYGPDLYAGDFNFLEIIALSVGAVGLLAMLLAAAGLYAVIAYVVSLRQREFGIRMAIGARPADLRRLVANAAMRLSLWGLVVGIVIGIPVAFGLRALLVGMSLRLLDPLVWVPVMLMLALVAFVAAFVPARRAARVDPVYVLRAD